MTLTSDPYHYSMTGNVLRCDVFIDPPADVDQWTDAQLSERLRQCESRLQNMLEFRLRLLEGPHCVHDYIRERDWYRSKVERMPEWETSFDELWGLDVGMRKLEPGTVLGNVLVRWAAKKSGPEVEKRAGSAGTAMGFTPAFRRAVCELGFEPVTPPEVYVRAMLGSPLQLRNVSTVEPL